MNEGRTFFGALRPLFDRFDDDAPDMPYDDHNAVVLSREELQESLIREIGRIVSTRMNVPESKLKGALGVVGYGLPERFGVQDSSSWDPENPAHRRAFATAVEHALLAFEPRLLNPSVHVQSASRAQTDVRIMIAGQACWRETYVEVRLPMRVALPT